MPKARVVSRRPSPASGRQTWSEVCLALRTEAQRHPAQLTVLSGLRFWRLFSVHWKSQNRHLSRPGRAIYLPSSLEDFEDRLAWCWSVASQAVDDATRVIASRLPCSELETEQTLEALQGAYIIFPDGGVHEGAWNTMVKEAAVRDTSVQRRIAANLASVERSQSEYRKTSGKPIFKPADGGGEGQGQAGA